MKYKDKYNEDYFDWQKNVGAFGGKANLFKFDKYIGENDYLLDFGCGGGYLLNNISCKKKIGIEINDVARKEAEKHGISCVKYISDIEDNFADIVISNHALEHVKNPYDILEKLYNKIKPGGKIVFVVPHQGPKEKYKESDINNHLYTWNPQTLGNLFKNVGYNIEKVETIQHKWPNNYYKLRKIFGSRFFDFICNINAIIKKNYQIKVIASKG